MATYIDTVVDGSPSRLITAVPDGAGPFPGVVITIHGGGLDAFEEDLADKLAAEGYIAAAPDIFQRQEPTDDSTLRRSRLRDTDLLNDIAAAKKWIAETGKADMSQLAIMGHCMGGRACYLGACEDNDYKAVVAYYGGNMFFPWTEDGKGQTPFDRLPNLKAAVLAFYGNEDKNPSPEDADKILAELDKLGVDVTSKRYDGAGHAFQNFLAPSFHEAATKDSWAKTVEFLAKHLK
jgi:carboxymethylenebutenolidase